MNLNLNLKLNLSNVNLFFTGNGKDLSQTNLPETASIVMRGDWIEYFDARAQVMVTTKNGGKW